MNIREKQPSNNSRALLPLFNFYTLVNISDFFGRNISGCWEALAIGNGIKAIQCKKYNNSFYLISCSLVSIFITNGFIGMVWR